MLLDFLFSKSHFDQFGRNSTDISHIIAAKIRFLIETTKEIAENLQAFSKLRNTIAELALSKADLIPYNHCFSKSSPCGPIPHNHLTRALMPRQPYSEAVKSDGEERFPLLP